MFHTKIFNQFNNDSIDTWLNGFKNPYVVIATCVNDVNLVITIKELPNRSPIASDYKQADTIDPEYKDPEIHL